MTLELSSGQCRQLGGGVVTWRNGVPAHGPHPPVPVEASDGQLVSHIKATMLSGVKVEIMKGGLSL